MRTIVAVAALLLVLLNVAPMVRTVGMGYLAIRDYLGRVWSVEDVEKIMNISIGEYSLGGLFEIYVDGVRYTLEDFMVYPGDGETAVLPITSGQHSILVKWAAYTQNSTVYIYENTLNILDIATAPVVPFTLSRAPVTDWVYEKTPEGLKIRKADNSAYVLFKKDSSWVQLYWKDDQGNDNYNTISITSLADNGLMFHVDRMYGEYNYTVVDKDIFGFTWTTAVVHEAVNITYPAPGVAIVSYMFTITEPNPNVFDSVKFFTYYAYALKCYVNYYDALFSGVGSYYIRSSYNMPTLADFIVNDYVKKVADKYRQYFSDKINNRITQVFIDVYLTQFNIVVLIHGRTKPPGTLETNEINIDADNAIDYGNIVMYNAIIKGAGRNWLFIHGQSISESNYPTIKVLPYYTYEIIDGDSVSVVHVPFGGKYYQFNVDDMSLYSYGAILVAHFSYGEASGWTLTYKAWVKICYYFNESLKADLFENRLVANGINYERNGLNINVSVMVSRTIPTGSSVPISIYLVGNFTAIEELVPRGSRGKIVVDYGISIHYNFEYGTLTLHNFTVYMYFLPRIVPVDVSLQLNGYYTVNNAFGIRVLHAAGNMADILGVLGYYLLDNEPPPSYVSLDFIQGTSTTGEPTVWEVYTIYPRDLWDKKPAVYDVMFQGNTTVYNVYMNPNASITYSDVTVCTFDWKRMSFVFMDPSLIPALINVPKGTPGAVLENFTGEQVKINVTENRIWLLDWYGWASVYLVKSDLDYNVYNSVDNHYYETIENNSISEYIYKVEFSQGNSTGRLRNINGELYLLVARIIYTWDPEYINKLIENLTRQLANEIYNNIINNTGADKQLQPFDLSWLSRMWLWLLLGFGLVFILILALAARGSKVIVQYTRPR